MKQQKREKVEEKLMKFEKLDTGFTMYKAGDWVKTTKDCGDVKAGRRYKVVLFDRGGIGLKVEPFLCIHPRRKGKNWYQCCWCYSTWIKL